MERLQAMLVRIPSLRCVQTANIYLQGKSAPNDFKEIAAEVASLHTALNEVSDVQQNPTSIINQHHAANRKVELEKLLQKCSDLLSDLERTLKRRRSLATANKRSWDRLRFSKSTVESSRKRLVSHTSSLSLFLTSLGTGSLGRIEQRLDQLARDIRAGKRASTIYVFGEQNEVDRVIWRELQEELCSGTITVEDLEAHRNGIQAYA